MKRVADPIHGTIPLEDLELALVESPEVQRLRNVKQLGLANMVFPGSDYSRFAHCLGVCHVTGRLLDALSAIEFITNEDRNLYRAAALLHDVGHYPFSHPMEQAIENYYKRTLTEASDASDAPRRTPVRSLNHEQVGAEIIRSSAALAPTLRGHGVDPDEIVAIIHHERESPKLANLISSDLDADRIDYLMRTAHHTGLPYGTVDLDYLLSQVRLDNEGRICLDPRAMRTAEHLLLARYFDYTQVSYHKTVAGLELLLKDVLAALLETGTLRGADHDVEQLIETGRWAHFDDAAVTGLIRALATEGDKSQREKAAALLARRGYKLIASAEWFGAREHREIFHSMVQVAKNNVTQWANDFSIPISSWQIWEQSVKITKIGSHLATAAAVEGDADEMEEAYEQAVRVLDVATGESQPIFHLANSLLSVLADNVLYGLRIYVFLPSDTPRARRDEMHARIVHDVPSAHWQ